MGQLVFQAALGGAVNLIGPNISATTNFTLPGADGTNGQALTTNGSGVLGFSSIVSGAAGSNTQVQFNSGGNFGASANLTWDGTTFSTTGLSASSTVTLSGGTANGVTYLNGSKVLTSGSALTFDGTNLATTGNITLSNNKNYQVKNSAGTNQILLTLGSDDNVYFGQVTSPSAANVYYYGLNQIFNSGSGEGMRLTSTGLGIGTSSPASKLHLAAAGTVLSQFSDTTNSVTAYLGILSSVQWIGTTTNHPISFNTNSSEQMRLTSTGLGIGTSSPSYKLDVYGTVSLGDPTISGSARQHFVRTGGGVTGSTTNGLTFKPGSASTTDQFARFETGSGTLIGAYGNVGDNLSIWTRDTSNAVTLTQAGNLGLGVTPSAWSSGGNMQLSTLTLAGNDYSIGSNYYQAGGNYKYVAAASTPAARLSFYGGAFTFLQAGAGTAGNNISSTTAMTLDTSGRLVVGKTSGNSRLSLGNNNVSTSNVDIEFTNDASISNYVFTGGSANATTRWRNNLVLYTGGAQDILFETNATERVRIDSSGNFCYGVAAFSAANNGFLISANGSSTYTAHTNGTASGATYSFFYYNNSAIGSITQSGTTAVLYNVTSDQRLKENIQDADSASSLIDSLRVRQFDWKTDGNHQRYGFVAQELVTVAPEAVHQPIDTEEMMAVDYSKLVPMLVKEIQSLRQRVAQLETN